MSFIDTVEIRPAVASDAVALTEFATRSFIDTYAGSNSEDDMRLHIESQFSAANQAREIADTSMATLLALSGTDLVGYAQLRPGSPPPCVAHARPFELQRLYVDKSAHGSGLATRLMDELFQAARSLGARHVWLSVWEHNPRAIAFYGKAGFVDFGAATFMLGPDPQTDRILVASLYG